MKNFWVFIFLVVASCNESSTNQRKIKEHQLDSLESIDLITNDSLIKETTQATTALEEDNKTKYGLIVDTLTIKSSKYIVAQSDPRAEIDFPLFILNTERDTIYKHEWYATLGFEFEDFNEDGILDIRLYQMSNIGGQSELIVYDSKNNQFKPVENFDQFFQPTKLKNTKYWYTYHKSGCADINWGSELYKIEKFVAVEIGDIKGIGCDGEEESGIFAFKVKGEKREKVYSEKRELGYYGDKWDFIEAYWTKNYKQFE